MLGIGGLGHLGVQYARHMGFEVAAIARGADKAELAKKLGAHHYIDSAATDPVAALQALGGAQVMLVTASSGKVVSQAREGLQHPRPSQGRGSFNPNAWIDPLRSDRSLDGRQGRSVAGVQTAGGPGRIDLSRASASNSNEPDRS